MNARCITELPKPHGYSDVRVSVIYVTITLVRFKCNYLQV